MLNELLDIEEVRTTDSVGEVNRLLQDGWDLIGFHPAPAAQAGTFGGPTTIFVMARVASYEEEEEESDFDTFEPMR
jgi:hypothetical protein